MGAGRADAAALSAISTKAGAPRAWPLVVRHALEADRDAVLSFATSTWHGWDYIPNAWPEWIDATDAAFLLGVVGDVGGSSLDADGSALTPGQPIAVTRVAMLSPTEAWLEGIRVDPRVRGMGVAADLQIAELNWVAAQGASVVRYATGADNEASHRLGAKDGIDLLVVMRSYWWTEDPDADEDDPSAFDASVREQATALRRNVLAGLARDGWLAAVAEADELWPLIANDPGFLAGHMLYEPRAWALSELSRDLFARHLERGEVVIRRQPSGAGASATDAQPAWSVAIIVREQLPSEDSALRAALLVGGVEPAIEILERARELAGQTVRFRLPESSPLHAVHSTRLAASGYRSPNWTMHILARDMNPANPVPVADPARVILAEDPEPNLVPPRW